MTLGCLRPWILRFNFGLKERAGERSFLTSMLELVRGQVQFSRLRVFYCGPIRSCRSISRSASLCLLFFLVWGCQSEKQEAWPRSVDLSYCLTQYPVSQDFRHYSQRCFGIDNDDIEDEEDLRHFAQRSLGINIADEEDRPGPSSSGTALAEGYSPENLENAVIIDERNRRINRRYKAEEVTFQARIDIEQIPSRLRITPLIAAVEAIRRLITLLILRCASNLRPTDLIRFCFDALDLDRHVSTSLMLVSALSVESVVAPIMRVLQSYKHLKLEHGVTVDAIIIHIDVGAGRGRKVLNIDTDRLAKQSILHIQPDESGLCCAKAILYALEHLENDRKSINAMRDVRRPTLLNRAKTLHRDAGVPLGPCTYKEIEVFEQWLNVQIVVISSESLNQVSYRGKDRSRRINLYLHNDHFDVIKYLKGFYGVDHYCESCGKPYGRIEDHRCSNACHVCFRIDCVPGQTKRCINAENAVKLSDVGIALKNPIVVEQQSVLLAKFMW
ncbi:hypothetical protein AVEN_10439-1 [Araneus ventricosus]|uniref:Uncharacterized protein n=1 Tax=Araneus ventricosus TaxID=182803 RepID=A0A4Y2TAB0_ARAVE|nr:hypothetical protein AVEN_10439-1 [Araneus ventricosus]